MNKAKIVLTTLFLLAILFNLLSAQQETSYIPNLTGPYLGQKPPGLTPEVFAPGIISTEANEIACSLSPDGKEIFFTRMNPEKKRNFIMVSIWDEKGWRNPEIAPKAGEYEGMEPYVSPDGKKLFFQTWRPVPGADKPGMDIWMCEKTDKGWGDPIHLENPFNPGKSMYISMANSGTIYTTDITGGMGTGNIVYSTLKEGKYQDFVKLPESINMTGREIYPCVSPDESFILFTRANEDRTASLFVSFRKSDGSWDEPKKIELGLPTAVMSRLSPDGKYLFFTSAGGPMKGEIYWVDAGVITAAKGKK
jgi:Tol biopolymer transport system component